jgi:hypothetical protein
MAWPEMGGRSSSRWRVKSILAKWKRPTLMPLLLGLGLCPLLTNCGLCHGWVVGGSTRVSLAIGIGVVVLIRALFHQCRIQVTVPKVYLAMTVALDVRLIEPD